MTYYKCNFCGQYSNENTIITVSTIDFKNDEVIYVDTCPNCGSDVFPVQYLNECEDDEPDYNYY